MDIKLNILACWLLKRCFLYPHCNMKVSDFNTGRGTTDMNFALSQIMKNASCTVKTFTYSLLVSLSADQVTGPFQKECIRHFVGFILSFPEGMNVVMREDSDRSQHFRGSSGTRQGCILPQLSLHFFSFMLHLKA